ncbi:hypothetical protein GXB78_12090 [Pseudomonas moraviensis subsp. stanleyae]|uniref:hypothetical protein n=1 Tax=Pseudomonas moraviensis TaxID=321662 RepID=UPI002E30BD43|nr:hypothetical protein [Pseudomonas moraviensis]MED7667936.1 hypothetical protein [Pseudomonas moraviensis subsp. stanleyae]
MKLKIAATVLGLAAMNNIYAAQCPEVSQISQKAQADGGFEYKAPFSKVGKKLEWIGGDKWNNESDKEKFAFTSVRIQPEIIDKADPKKSKVWAVICRYEGQGVGNEEANVTMVLKPGKKVKTDSPNWGKPSKDSSSTAPVGKLDCVAEDPAECAFKLN